ncbi:carbohydrate sulfotransferase 10-like [Palaemon carinicauda]|uniref:carbohydrate sulfotransferase 10-like n=1 Tax=Palaemon carinicauda TaxID=392227 RepID=UPI0035B574BD
MAGEKVNRKMKLLSTLVICVGITFMASTLLLQLTPVQHYTSGILKTLYSRNLNANEESWSGEGGKIIESKEKHDFSGVHFKDSGKDKEATSHNGLGVGGTTSSSSKLITETPTYNYNSYSSSGETQKSFVYRTVSTVKNAPGWPVRENNASTERKDDVDIRRKDESSSDQSEERIWEEMVRRRFDSRKKSLETQCDAYGGNIPPEVARGNKEFFYYSKSYNLLACVSAKGGSSTWRSHFLSMNGYDKPYNQTHTPELDSWIRARKVIGENFLEQLTSKKGLTRLISVRHPFSRLVSAYTDKYNGGKPLELTKKRAMFYRKPLEMIGRNFTLMEVAAFPFPLFLRFVLYQKSRGFDRHWVPYSRNCKPCGLPYDYVVHLETLEDDLSYIIQQLGIKEIDPKTQKHISVENQTHSFDDYFKDIPQSVIREIYSIYKEDFRLFGYAVPQFVKDAFANSKLGDINISD